MFRLNIGKAKLIPDCCKGKSLLSIAVIIYKIVLKLWLQISGSVVTSQEHGMCGYLAPSIMLIKDS
jgi:hypothetical protein